MSDVFQINLTVTDGQVAAAETEVTAGRGNHARRYNVTFANVGGQTETLEVKISRGGGTSRRLKKVILSPDEQLEIVGLPLNSTDSLRALTTNANSVDYTVSFAPPEAPLAMTVYDIYGGVKTAPYILEQLDVLNAPTPT